MRPKFRRIRPKPIRRLHVVLSIMLGLAATFLGPWLIIHAVD